jgi:hypothetical protein
MILQMIRNKLSPAAPLFALLLFIWAGAAGTKMATAASAQDAAADAPGLVQTTITHDPVTEPKIHGVIISTHLDGRDWGWDTIVPTLRAIQDVGAGWVSTHPYASIRADGTVRWREFSPDDPPEWLVRPIHEAHALGMKVMIKPHLAYWGSPFAWRGEIDFDSPEKWSRFWESYTRWVVLLAEASSKADGFAVGTELTRTLGAGHEENWRSLIRQVRKKADFPLTYAANWSHYQAVRFWDAVDVIGIQAYFPITDQPSPDATVIRAGWAARMDELHRYSDVHNRRIVFTELGYNRSFSAPAEPWAYKVDGIEAEPLQETLLRVALEAVDREPRVAGVFLWKWFPDPHPVGRNFQLATPRLKKAISSTWKD